MNSEQPPRRKGDLKKMHRVIIFCAVTLLTGSASALADNPRFGDTLTVSVGGMIHRGEASLSSTRPGAPVSRLTFTDLGFDDSTNALWADLAWQFARRWQFRLNYSSFDTRGVSDASAAGNFGDLDWSVGAALTSTFDLDLYIAEVTWDFLESERGHLGAGIGVHAADLELDVLLEVSGSFGGSGGRATVRQEQASVLAPLPNASLAGGYRLGEHWYVRGDLAYFSLSYDKYDGELFSARASVELRPWDHVGFGLAYQYVNMNLEVDASASHDVYDLEFHGPVLFLAVGF